MVPAQRGGEPDVSQLGYLLSGDHERTASLVRAAGLPPAGPTVESLVRAWLADPGDGYGPGGVPALAALAPRRRAAVVLRHWAGVPVPEVARILGCAEEEVDGPGEWSAQELRTVAARALGARRRHRTRSVAAALGVLAVTAVLATVMGVGSPEQTPEAEVSTPRRTPTADQHLATPAPGAGPVVVDARARRLTEQLALAVDRELPELVVVRAGPSGPLTGNTERPPLEFYTRAETDPPGKYVAQAMLDAHGQGALLLLEVWRVAVERAGWEPRCPGFERDCAYREFPDRTRAEVEEFVDPGSGGHGRRLTALRPDGTFARVTVYGPALGLAEMFRFARVFTW